MHACARVCIFAKLFGEFNVAIGTWVFLCGVGLQVRGGNAYSTSACLRRCACASCWAEMAAGNWVQAAHSTDIFIISSFSPLPVCSPYPLVSCLTASLLLLFITFSLSHTSSYTFLGLFIRSALFVPHSFISVSQPLRSLRPPFSPLQLSLLSRPLSIPWCSSPNAPVSPFSPSNLLAFPFNFSSFGLTASLLYFSYLEFFYLSPSISSLPACLLFWRHLFHFYLLSFSRSNLVSPF